MRAQFHAHASRTSHGVRTPESIQIAAGQHDARMACEMRQRRTSPPPPSRRQHRGPINQCDEYQKERERERQRRAGTVDAFGQTPRPATNIYTRAHFNTLVRIWPLHNRVRCGAARSKRAQVERSRVAGHPQFNWFEFYDIPRTVRARELARSREKLLTRASSSTSSLHADDDDDDDGDDGDTQRHDRHTVCAVKSQPRICVHA